MYICIHIYKHKNIHMYGSKEPFRGGAGDRGRWAARRGGAGPTNPHAPAVNTFSVLKSKSGELPPEPDPGPAAPAVDTSRPNPWFSDL